MRAYSALTGGSWRYTEEYYKEYLVRAYSRMFHDQTFDQILKSYTPYASLDTQRKSMQETHGP